MRVLVTVGTSPFESLIAAADELSLPAGWEMMLQIGSSIYEPRNHPWLRLSSNFTEELVRSDLVIAHAGIGIVFELLALKKSFLVCPNMERADRHQIELADFVEHQQLASVCRDLSYLRSCVLATLDFTPKEFVPQGFDKFQEIAATIASGS